MSTHETEFWQAGRSLYRWALCALSAWLLLAVMLAGMDHAQPDARPFSFTELISGPDQAGLLARMRELTVWTISLWVLPTGFIAVFLALQGLIAISWGRRWFGGRRASAGGEADGVSQAWQWIVVTACVHAFKFGAMFFAVFAVIWAGFAALAYADGNDHWEALPAVTPPYLSEFLARHPGLSANRVGTQGALVLRDDEGRTVSLNGSDLTRARAVFDACPQTIGAEQLGGITPFPGARCGALLRLDSVTGDHLIYVFRIDDGSDLAAIESHFSRWSEASNFGGSGSSRSSRSYQFSSSSQDNAWRVQVDARSGGATTILVRYTRDKGKASGTTPPQR